MRLHILLDTSFAIELVASFRMPRGNWDRVSCIFPISIPHFSSLATVDEEWVGWADDGLLL